MHMLGEPKPRLAVQVEGDATHRFEFLELIIVAGNGGQLALVAELLDHFADSFIFRVFGQVDHNQLDLAEVNFAPEIEVTGVSVDHFYTFPAQVGEFAGVFFHPDYGVAINLGQVLIGADANPPHA